MKTPLTAILLVTVSCACWLASSQENAPSPDALRERAGRLEEKARDLKAEGRHDEAMRAMNQARELGAQAQRLTQRDRPLRPAARAQELKEQHARVASEMKELRAAGKEAEANELERKLDGIERELEAVRRGMPERQEVRRREEPDRAPNGPDFQRRANHLQAAIENLRAAGLPDIAERLTQQREELLRRTGMEPGGPAPMAEVRRLRAEMQELRQALMNLNRRVERLGNAVVDRGLDPANREGRRGPRLTGENRPEERDNRPNH